jgi:hypothetical protein
MKSSEGGPPKLERGRESIPDRLRDREWYDPCVRPRLLNLAAAVSLVLPLTLAGCASTGDAKLGASITEVQAVLGMPDAISDSSGDMTRYYAPRNRPAEEWPADATRTFYYLRSNRQVVFKNGRLKSSSSIDGEVRKVVSRVAQQPTPPTRSAQAR